MTVQVWRHQMVLRQIAAGVFEEEDEDTLFRLDMDVWEKLGCPETITVTVEPGAFNGE